MNRYSAIKDMYYGRRGDGQLIKPTKEYHEQFSKLNDISEKLKDKLNGDCEGLELLEAFFWASAGVEAEAVAQHYSEGFSFGLLMGIEIARMQ